MQIIISILIIGLLWMIYDLINAPEVDEDENYILPMSDSEEDQETDEKSVIKKPEVQETEKVPDIE